MTPHILKHDNGVTLVVVWVWPDGRVRLAHYDMTESVELTAAEFQLVTQLQSQARDGTLPSALLALLSPTGGDIMPPQKETD